MNNVTEWWDDLTDGLENDPEYQAESISIDLAIKINEKMNEKKISRAELAKKLQVSKAYISQALQGKNNMTLLTICKLGAALDLNPKVLFEDKELPEENIIPFKRSDEWAQAYINADDVTLQGLGEKIFDSENTHPDRDDSIHQSATV